MPAFDLPLDVLQTYRSPESPPPGLADFWAETMRQTDAHPLNLSRTSVANGLRLSRTFDLRMAGFGGDEIRAWLQVPADVSGPVPAVVQFHGYSDGRGMPLASSYVEAGFAHLQLDSRGQGWYSASTFDLTPDDHPGSNGVPGMMTRGVLSPETYYYRRLMADAVRLVQAAAALDEVDAQQIVVCGGSQGGGLAIAAAGICALTGIPLAGAMPDVPFLSHYRRGVDVADAGPYPEIEVYLASRPHEAEQVFETLSYFDAVHLGAWARCPALFSVGLRDNVCPPSTVFAAFNAWGDEDKHIDIYPWNRHEGGREIQVWKQLEWLHARLSVDREAARTSSG